MHGLTALAVAILLPATAFAQATENLGFVDFRLIYGAKGLDGEVYGPVGEQTQYGVETSLGSNKTPLAVAVDVLHSRAADEEDGVHWRASTTELALGARLFLHTRSARFFIGGGFAPTNVQVVKDEDPGFGGSYEHDSSGTTTLWAQAGALRRLGKRMHGGAVLRVSRGEAKVFDERANAGGISLAFTFGWAFGGAYPNTPR